MAIYIPDRPRATYQQAISILTRHTAEVGIYIDIERVLDYQIYASRNIETMTPLLREYLKDSEVTATQTGATLSLVLDRFDVDPGELLNLQRRVSLGKDVRQRIIEENRLDPEFIEFIKFYDELRESTTILSQSKAYMGAPASSKISNEGKRMVIVKPTWEPTTTRRLSSSNPNFQGMTRFMKDIITAPEGFILVQADSGQIEPRIMYSEFIKDDLIKRLIEVYDDAYWGQLHYVLMTPQEEVDARADLSLVKKKDWDPKLRDDLKKLGLAGSYGSTNLDRFNRDLAAGYMDKIINHPLRKEWEMEAKRLVYKEGATKFYSVFGTEIEPEVKEGKYADVNAWKSHLVRCAINNPLQGTAADLMSESVYEVDNFMKYVCKKPASIAAYIHDAGYFYLHEDESHHAQTLGGCLAYNVRDWIPIRSDVEIGKIKLSHVPVY